MIKNILYLLVIAVIGWVIYVSLYGKSDDIKLRNNLLEKGKELGLAVSDIFKSETKKVNSGDYDEVFSKLNETLDELKKASKNKEQNDEIARLSEEKERLEKSIKENEGNQEKLSVDHKKLQILADDIVTLTKKIEG
jgi:predicted ribosome quality control (RQC) complex YloA/Tae2 family protein